ncbi:MAG: hypothetical protein NUK62_08450 [Tenericutes bacterium]|nr:hypothetical protein [Mycoplasmatota bacterium]
MKKCPKCGEEYRFTHSCPRTCIYCGKQFNSNFGHRWSEDGKDFHWDCHKNEMQQKRLCSNCAFLTSKELVKDIRADDLGVNISTKTDYYCRLLKIEIEIPPSERLIVPAGGDFICGGKEAEECVNFISKKEYKEKALKGEIKF